MVQCVFRSASRAKSLMLQHYITAVNEHKFPRKYGSFSFHPGCFPFPFKIHDLLTCFPFPIPMGFPCLLGISFPMSSLRQSPTLASKTMTVKMTETQDHCQLQSTCKRVTKQQKNRNQMFWGEFTGGFRKRKVQSRRLQDTRHVF